MRLRVYLLCLVVLVLGSNSAGAANVVVTKHNLSSSAPTYAPANTIYSSLESQVCLFCHTPHNANPALPLWNHELSGAAYTMYESRSVEYNTAEYPVPTGSSKLCLSCHDGTVAVGAANGTLFSLEGTNPDGTVASPTNLTTDLSDDHPVSIPVVQTGELWAPEQFDPTTTSPVKLENGLVQCSSCHDPHTTNSKFLVLSMDYGNLCQECHHQEGWDQSAHGGASGVSWTDPATGVTKSVAQWACSGCHDMHRASEQELLQSDGDPTRSLLEEVCYRCHDGSAAPAIEQEFYKTYSHPVQNAAYDSVHYPTEPNPPVETHIECSDCHDPHYGQAGNRALGDDTAGGMLAGIKAPRIIPGQFDFDNPLPVGAWQPPNYGAANEISYEYELCLKCHGTQSSMNLSRDHKEDIDVYFNPRNKASHGCITRNERVNPYVQLGFREELGWTSTTTIACCDCHGNEDTSANRVHGPHGSIYDWLLRQSQFTDPGNYNVVCYECHDFEVYGYGANQPNRTAFDDHGLTSHWVSKSLKFPPDTPQINCFICHGDFSNGLDRTALDPLYGGYTPGGLHGANSGRADRPSETFGVHFLNGMGLRISASETDLFLSPKSITCGSYVDADGYGCGQHTNRDKSYTR